MRIAGIVFGIFFACNAAGQRCEPSLRVDHTQQFAEIVALLQQGRDAESFAKLREYRVPMGNMAGAMQVKCEATAPPPPPVGVLEMPRGPANFRMSLPTFSEPIAFRFVVADGPRGTPGYSTIVEYQGDVALRQCTVSRSPGDFRQVSPGGVSGPFDMGQGVQCSVIWNLPPGTYYFNVRNVQPGVWPALVETRWPQ